MAPPPTAKDAEVDPALGDQPERFDDPSPLHLCEKSLRLPQDMQVNHAGIMLVAKKPTSCLSLANSGPRLWISRYNIIPRTSPRPFCTVLIREAVPSRGRLGHSDAASYGRMFHG
jgi:hypothetical protein